MKTIILNEDKLHLLKETNVSYGKFFNCCKDFLKSLLNNPSDAELPNMFKENGISKEKLISKLKKIGILKSEESIIEVPIDEGKQRAKHTIKYTVRRKLFMDRMKEVYKQLFGECNSVFANEKKVINDILDMDNDNAYKKRGGYKLESLQSPFVTPFNAFNSFLKTNMVLAEGIIKTYNGEWVANKIAKAFSLHQIFDSDEDMLKIAHGMGNICCTYSFNKEGEPTEKEPSKIYIILTTEYGEDAPKKDFKEKINPFMKACGWNVAVDSEVHGDTCGSVYEKEHYEKEDELPLEEEYFHITPKVYVDKIMDKGLCPKHKGKMSSHPSRVYLLPKSCYSKYAAINFAKDLSEHINERIPRIYNVIKVDTSKCNFKVYGDPNYFGGAWTYNNIPPQALEVVDEINLEDL